jgi:hypothetical protein
MVGKSFYECFRCLTTVSSQWIWRVLVMIYSAKLAIKSFKRQRLKMFDSHRVFGIQRVSDATNGQESEF